MSTPKTESKQQDAGDYSDTSVFDTDVFNVEDIVSEVEKHRATLKERKLSARQRLEAIRENKRLREALRDYHDEDFLDGEFDPD